MRRGIARWFLPIGPDFRYADLRNVDFYNHPLFGFNKGGGGNSSAKFQYSNLENANFENISVYGFTDAVYDTEGRQSLDAVEGPFLPKYLNIYPGDSVVVQRYGLDSASTLSPAYKEYARTLSIISDQFAGSNWEKAKFPPGMREWFKESPPGLQAKREYSLD